MQLNKYIGQTEAFCPYCNKELKKFPKAKTKCPNCGNYIYKRTRPFDNKAILVKEDELQEIEKEWEKKYPPKENTINMDMVLSLLFDNNHYEQKILYKLFTEGLIKKGDAQKLLNLKNHIDYIYLNIFDLDLDFFLSYKQEVEEVKRTTNISIYDIAWYKLQNDEFDANSDKHKPIYKRLYKLYKVYKYRSIIKQYKHRDDDSFMLYVISLYFYISYFVRLNRLNPIFLIKDFIYNKYDIEIKIPFEQRQYIDKNNIDLKKKFLNVDTSAGGLYNIYPPERLLKYLP